MTDQHDEVDRTETRDPASVHVGGIPTRIGRYRIKRVIASGGMGTVYEALQEQPRRTVAIKLMRAGIASRSALRRFEYESQLLARLRHPGIAQVFEAGTHGEGELAVPYFAMEYIVGAKPITEYVQAKKLGTRDRMKLFASACEAVHHGHQKGIIHRDLKPSNVLVDSSGQVKIIDFGVARCTDSDLMVTTLQTDVGQLIGTLQYMSPEQCAADPHDIDTRSDVYALGVIFYEMLCERLPYDVKGAAIHEATRVIREQEPTRLSSYNKTLRGDVETIALKALEKDRDRRYQSASALTADIGRYLGNEPISARPASAMYQFRKLVARHKAPFAFLAVLVVLISVFGIWMGVLYAKSEHLRREAVAARNQAEQVARFQASQFARIDPAKMGLGLRQGLLREVRAMLKRSGRDTAEIDQRMDDLDSRLSGANFTNLALDTLEKNIFSSGLETIHKQFADQPVVQARLLATIGATMRSLGLLDAAGPPLEQALAIRRAALGDDHPDTLTSIDDMGCLFMDQGKLDEAVHCFREAWEGRRRVLGNDHPATLCSLNNMATALQTEGKLDEAMRYCREALDGRRRVFGADDEDMLNSLNNFGGLLAEQGKLDEARRIWHDVLERRRRVLGNDHPDTLVSINNLGGVLMELGKPDEALPLCRESVERHRRVLGDDHPDTLAVVGLLAGTLQELGQFDEALHCYREAVEGERRVLGSDHPRMLMTVNNLGSLLNELGRYEEAVAVLSASEAAARRVWTGGNARWLGNYLAKLGEARTGLGRFPEAESTLLEAHQLLAAGFGENHKRTIATVKHLVALYDAWHAAEPGKGYDAKAGEWRAKLPKDEANGE